MWQRLDNIQQGSDEWHKLRSENYKTASRTPAVLGISPFSNKEKLAQEIKFDIKPFYSKAMQLGNELEDKVRELANIHLEDVFMPTVGIRDGFLASLDGINFSEDTIIEIKVSDKTFEEIENGIIPNYYYAQIQHQMMVFNSVEKAFLVAYSPTKDKIIASETIARNEELHKTICDEWSKFDEFMKTYEMPVKNEIDDSEAVILALDLFEINEQKKALEVREKAIKEELLKVATGEKTMIGNLTISKQKGSKKIDYVKLINDKQVDVSDIDNYTTYNKDSFVFRFSK